MIEIFKYTLQAAKLVFIDFPAILLNEALGQLKAFGDIKDILLGIFAVISAAGGLATYLIRKHFKDSFREL